MRMRHDPCANSVDHAPCANTVHGYGMSAKRSWGLIVTMRSWKQIRSEAHFKRASHTAPISFPVRALRRRLICSCTNSA